MFLITPSLLVSTMSTLFTSWRIPRLKTYSAAFSASIASGFYVDRQVVSWCTLLLVNLFIVGLGSLEPVGFCIKPGGKAKPVMQTHW
jgi:hypothetical protein